VTVRWRVETHGGLSSTQDAAANAARAGAPEGLVIQALTQSAGRGRRGRAWVSPRGGLYLSALLRPGCRAARAGELALMAGVALARALPGVRLKWPNDALLPGGKCAGILVESESAGGRVAWAAVGIGVNIDTAPPGAAAVPGPLEAVRGRTLDALADTYALWRAQGLAPIRAAWLEASAHALGQTVTAAGRTGTFEGLDADGALLLSGRRITAGAVEG
jgi:BirA family transcriptional regulator, biotin operon repressor / biotin---[acetyl-CoA-carboxylase] ligase